MEQTHALWLTLIGAAVISATLMNALFRKFGLPALVGYILLGFGIRLFDQYWPVLSPAVNHAFDLLASLGLVALLFRIGLESRPEKLLRELPRASVVGIGDVAVSGLVAFAAAYWWLGLDLVISLTAAAALVATSVGVSIGSWREAGVLDTRDGRLLLDVAELDDIVGVILMGLLLSVVPLLLGDGGEVWGAVGRSAFEFFIKFVIFAAGCLVVSRYLEGNIVAWSTRVEPNTGVMLTVLGLGFIIAAVAGWLGFSLAVGALFAGLVFSRDPRAVRTEGALNDVYSFFVPFFFIGIGLDLDPAALASGLELGLILLVAAIVGKLLGDGLTAWRFLSSKGALLIGLSMVPRAEITMVIMHQGKAMGPEVVPDSLYAGMVFVTAATSLIAPVLLRPAINRWRDHLQ